MMRTILIIILILLFPTHFILAQTYNWPCVPFNQQHNINGTFCENRTGIDGDRDHFHDGVDIALAENNYVYSVISGTVTSLATREQSGINAYVRVGDYAYVHVDPAPGITVGTEVTAFETIIGTTNSWNHIHFKDGVPGSEINALRDGGGLSPFSDTHDPAIDYIEFYANGTTTQFQNNRIYGRVEIVAKARDRTDGGPIGDNNGIFSIGYQIYDSSGTIPITEPVENFVFYTIPASDNYITNVYFPGSNLSTYIYTITNKINTDGYWDTAQLETGVYQVKVFTEDTRSNTIERWETVEIVLPDYNPPAIPELVSLTGNDANQWMLNWFPNDSADHAGYNLMFSFDAVDWTVQDDISGFLTAADTQYVFDGFPDHTTIYFRLNAYDNAAFPNNSEPSDAFGVRLADGGPEVLIVDGFDRMDGYWQEPNHTFVSNYGSLLSDFDIAFNTCSDDAIIENKISLDDYPVIIYLLGDESGENRALSSIEQTALKNFLHNGGNLIISGSEIGNDLVAMGDEDDQLFYHSFLKADFLADSAESYFLSGENGTVFEDYSGEIMPPVGSIYNSDVITFADSEIILRFEDGTGAGVYYSGNFEGGSSPGQLAHFSFPIELLSDEDRQDLIERVLNLFGTISSSGSLAYFGIPTTFEMSQNYPNPFNPKTIINYELPITNFVTLDIYNSIGQKVSTLVDEKQSAGSYEATWDASDFSSGVYYYVIKAGDFREVRKMVLLR
jgi:hypothetical protein